MPRHGTRLYPDLAGDNLGSGPVNIILRLQSTRWCPSEARPPQRRRASHHQSEALVPGLHAAGGPPQPQHCRPDLRASLGTEERSGGPGGQERPRSCEGRPASGALHPLWEQEVEASSGDKEGQKPPDPWWETKPSGTSKRRGVRRESWREERGTDPRRKEETDRDWETPGGVRTYRHCTLTHMNTHADTPEAPGLCIFIYGWYPGSWVLVPLAAPACLTVQLLPARPRHTAPLAEHTNRKESISEPKTHSSDVLLFPTGAQQWWVFFRRPTNTPFHLQQEPQMECTAAGWPHRPAALTWWFHTRASKSDRCCTVCYGVKWPNQWKAKVCNREAVQKDANKQFSISPHWEQDWSAEILHVSPHDGATE